MVLKVEDLEIYQMAEDLSERKKNLIGGIDLFFVPNTQYLIPNT
jgi:hypothetical protein